LPDNDNNSLLDPKVKEQVLRDLSLRLRELHEAIENASGALEQLKDTAEQDKTANER
jgi:hypothetical protein